MKHHPLHESTPPENLFRPDSGSTALDRRVLAGAILLTGLVAGALSILFNRHGLYFTPDSWAAWENSVSLLQEGRYTYIGGHPQTFWLPFYAGYLAVVQGIVGVSGAGLIIAQALLCFGNGLAWAAFAVFISRDYGDMDGRLRWRVLGVCLLVVALFVPNNLFYPVSNSLELVFVPFVIALSAQYLIDTSPGRAWIRSLASGGCLLAALLAHSSAMVLIPLTVFAPLVNRGTSRSSRIAQAGTIAILALPVWLLLQQSLRANNYALGAKAVDAAQNANLSSLWSPDLTNLQLLEQVLWSSATFFLPVKLAWIGVPILAGAVVLLSAAAVKWGYRYWRHNRQGAAPTIRIRAFWTVVHVLTSVALLWVLYGVFQYDPSPLAGRFVWHCALALVPLVLFETARRPKPWLWIAGTVLLVGLGGRATKFTLVGIVPARQTESRSFSDTIVYRDYTIRTASAAGPDAALVVVCPPDYPWTGRREGACHERQRPLVR